MMGFAVIAGSQTGKRNANFSDFATSLHRYFATIQKCPLEKIPPLYIATSLQSQKMCSLNTITHRYIATSLQPTEKRPPKKKYPLATSLLRYNLPKNGLRKIIPPRYIATSLQSQKMCFLNTITHRYIATSLQPTEKRPPKKKYPLATSLLRYNLPKMASEK